MLYRTPSQAAITFEDTPAFTYVRFVTLWKESDIAYAAQFAADEFFLACTEGRSDSGFRYRVCTSEARYDRFLTAFSSWVSPAYMSEEEMVQVLQTIDRNMLQCIETYGDREWELEERRAE